MIYWFDSFMAIFGYKRPEVWEAERKARDVSFPAPKASAAAITPKRWKPQYGCEYYAIKSSGLIAHSIFHNGLSEDCTYNFGNCFQTSEQAIEAARRVRETLLNYHKELNNDQMES